MKPGDLVMIRNCGMSGTIGIVLDTRESYKLNKSYAVVKNSTSEKPVIDLEIVYLILFNDSIQRFSGMYLDAV
tara:strand:+ start:64 stop:282 length:219 start_codon:yes stop_codon:yes gene_type:complete